MLFKEFKHHSQDFGKLNARISPVKPVAYTAAILETVVTWRSGVSAIMYTRDVCHENCSLSIMTD